MQSWQTLDKESLKFLFHDVFFFGHQEPVCATMVNIYNCMHHEMSGLAFFHMGTLWHNCGLGEFYATGIPVNKSKHF